VSVVVGVADKKAVAGRPVGGLSVAGRLVADRSVDSVLGVDMLVLWKVVVETLDSAASMVKHNASKMVDPGNFVHRIWGIELIAASLTPTISPHL